MKQRSIEWRRWFSMALIGAGLVSPNAVGQERFSSPASPSYRTVVPAQAAGPPMSAIQATPKSQVFPDGFPTFDGNYVDDLSDNSPATSTKYPLAPYSNPELHFSYSDYGSERDEIPEYAKVYGVFDYAPVSNLLPDYYYRAEYYQTSDVGARPIADYAPPGYEARDYESAPGVPEFTPISPPLRPSAATASTYVTRGIMPGSFLVPGTSTSFRFRGFVRLAALADLQPIGVPDAFVTNAIPVPQTSGQNFNMSGRISRFALESWTPTPFLEWNAHTFIEGDFFNGAGQAAGGGGNPFRLRHAFVDFGYFRFGQQNSVFMDGTNWPSLVDFQGPNSWVNQRQPSVRVTLPVADRVYWAASMERPFSDITTNGLGTNVQDVPDFASHLRYEGDVGHVQFSGVLRTIGYRPNEGDTTRLTGGGICGSVVVHPWAYMMGTDPVHDSNPSGMTRSRILLMSEWGPGLGRYINDLAGQGFDAQVNPMTGDLKLVDAFGCNASYEHWYCENWLSNFTLGYVDVNNNAGQLASTYDTAKYAAASLWWIPVPRMSLGIEYLFGQRDNLDGQDAQSQRVHGLFQYNF